jgi:uncharacterized membrane protein
MQRRLGSVTRIGRKIDLNDEQGFLFPVLLALIIVVVVVAGYAIVMFNASPEEYNTIYLLDGQQKAVDYPEILIANRNSTFSVYVNVDNHMNSEQTFQVQTKIAQNLLLTEDGIDTQPVDTYNFTIPVKGSNQRSVTVTENNVGSYVVVFELWQFTNGSYIFTHNYCVLNIKVTN